MSDTDNSKKKSVAFIRIFIFQISNYILRNFFKVILNKNKITATITSSEGLAFG